MSHSDNNRSPAPAPMPQGAREWSRKWSLVHFINAYNQIRDCLAYRPANVLIIGVGLGFEPMILKEKFGINTTTLDIDPGFAPDYVGSVHDMHSFTDQQFDVALASHVLEHFRFSLFDQALSELSRVAKHSIVYLPYGGRHCELKLVAAQRHQEWHLRVSLPPVRKRYISGEEPDLQEGQHYWECGYPGFGIAKVRKLMEKVFVIDRMYQNPDFLYSLNFLLTSKRVSGSLTLPDLSGFTGFEFLA